MNNYQVSNILQDISSGTWVFIHINAYNSKSLLHQRYFCKLIRWICDGYPNLEFKNKAVEFIKKNSPDQHIGKGELGIFKWSCDFYNFMINMNYNWNDIYDVYNENDPESQFSLAEHKYEIPLNPAETGKGLWICIHTIAYHATSPDNQKICATSLTWVLSSLPCHTCRGHAIKYLAKNPFNVPTEDHETFFFKWTCEIHNHANKNLNKNLIVDWKDAWKGYANLNPITKRGILNKKTYF